MYVPASFKMSEQPDVLALMKANPFAALVSRVWSALKDEVLDAYREQMRTTA